MVRVSRTLRIGGAAGAESALVHSVQTVHGARFSGQPHLLYQTYLPLVEHLLHLLHQQHLPLLAHLAHLAVALSRLPVRPLSGVKP